MLPKFADTTTTIIYCVHCRCSSSSSSACIISDEAETENTNRLCSRCKVVHYCSKECQKLHYQFHKKRCQLIHKLRNEILIMEKKKKKKEENEEDDHVGIKAEVDDVKHQKQKRYELSYLIFELGYMSTDTIERGKYIYQCSLLEYYKLLQIDFYATGVLESILLLLSILDDRNYDKYCISLIKYVLYNTNDNDNNSEFLCWDYGDITTTSSASTFEISDYKKFRNLLAIRHHHPNNNSKNWSDSTNTNTNTNPNILFVPLMIIKMRQYADIMTNTKIHTDTRTRTHTHHGDRQQSMMQLLNLKKEIAEICYRIEIEYETNSSSDNEKLPVMKSLFPDSNQHWGEEEAQMLLANQSRRVTTETTTTTTKNNQNNDNQNDNEWKKCCFIYWMFIKDCYAYTPGLLDAVEDIIMYMEYSEEESKSSKSKEGYTSRSVIPDDDIGNNDNGNDPSSESSDNSGNQSEEYISFIDSMSSTAQEQQHKQQQEEEVGCKEEEDYP
ncbi:hypothetical protein FRACYDRAFT_240922 [Fragilariopsis cylindrus CCMP1102]|uniref:MYND-type domain-containing protein n=1 Tax=Fragilariopsis cylindrus CCMP1102 TaxID=635003 RepID=A0A1E7F860_9STRA|nr:hypothetical protein FRACYDRAFT_240922 [Fragilariopsis cylindrus CCMP1102]|eukprot:OEU14382.1 hypothetical protein FRACYDRAFT_240922 [Fragilariopsis cylindrus CCMP1102]